MSQNEKLWLGIGPKMIQMVHYDSPVKQSVRPCSACEGGAHA